MFLALTFVLGKVLVLLGALEDNWFGPYSELPCSGLLPMSLAFISIQSFAAMDGNTSVFGYVDIPNKFYPVIVYLIVTLLSGSMMRPELLAGLIMGSAKQLAFQAHASRQKVSDSSVSGGNVLSIGWP